MSRAASVLTPGSQRIILSSDRMEDPMSLVSIAVAALAALGPAATAAPAAGDQPRTDFDPTAVSTADVARVVGADHLWARGVTGAGIGVALVDTGVSPVPGLRSGNVVDGPDLS